MQIAVSVEIFDACHLAAVIMHNTGHMGAFAHFQIACRFTTRDVGIGGRPFRTELAALEAEANLLAGGAFIIIGAVVAAVILVAIIAIIFAICRKNNKKDDDGKP